MALHQSTGSISNANGPTLRHCLDCPTLTVGRSPRCETCRKARTKKMQRASMKRYLATSKGRTYRTNARQRWRAKHPEAHAKHNRAYRARNPEAARASALRWRAKNPDWLPPSRRGKSPKRPRKAAALRSMPAPAYPFVSRPNTGNALVLAVNALVPQGAPGREDICQNIVLAILEGKATIANLQSNRAAVAKFCRAHHRESFEASGYAVSLSEPRRDGRSWHDVLPDTDTPWIEATARYHLRGE